MQFPSLRSCRGSSIPGWRGRTLLRSSAAAAGCPSSAAPGRSCAHANRHHPPRRHDVTGPQPRRQCEQRDHGVPRADHPRRTGPNNPFLLAIAEDGDYRVKTFDARQIGYRLVLHVLRSPTPAQCRRRAIARQLRDQGIQDQAGSGIGNPPRFRGNHTAQGHRVRGLSKPTADRNRHVPMDVLPWRWWPLGRADTAARPPSG